MDAQSLTLRVVVPYTPVLGVLPTPSYVVAETTAALVFPTTTVATR